MKEKFEQLNRYGYVILKANKMLLLKKLKQEYLKIVKKNGLSGSLKSISKANESQLNKIHIEFNKKSKNCNFNLINSFSYAISKVLGRKIFIQRQPYLRIKKYNLRSTATIPHNDYDFGHSHLGFNLWAPLYDISNNEGIYIYNLNNSQKIYSKFKFNCHLSDHIKINNYEKKKKYLNLKFGEAVFFSNLCIHGASVISGRFNRVSSNIHLQSFNVPINEKSTEFFTIAELNKNFFYKQIGI